jgi:hypothetical protein
VGGERAVHFGDDFPSHSRLPDSHHGFQRVCAGLQTRALT